MSARALSITAVALAALATACALLPHREAAPARREPGEVRRPVPPDVIRDWLECEECLSGELAAVVRLGDAAVPQLREIAERGLSPVGRATLVAQLGRRHDERVAWGEQDADLRPTMSREAYVRHHLASRDHLYRVRAIRALGAIDSEAARRALRTVLARTRHEGLAAEIRRMLGGT